LLRAILEPLAREVSGNRAFDQVAEIVRHHRIQASPGFREAARHCMEQLLRSGISAELVSYPAAVGQGHWGHSLFAEWAVQDARLWLTEPSAEACKLADFHDCPLSLIQRSHPTPPEGVEAEMEVVDAADRPQSYEGREVSGKLLLITGQLGAARRLAVEQRGALGLLVDELPEWPPVRRRPDLPDARVYASFWEAGDFDRPCFGFVLSGRQGALLRRLRAAGTVRLRAVVRSRFYEGAVENVEGFLPGSEPEEVLLVAHLCHPRPSANDNASGAAALLEAARTLAEVLRRGELPALRRGIRFLLVPEMTGTYAYLATREDRIPLTVAALNLDMVGQRQDLCGSSLLVERPPLATPNFAGDLAAAVLSEVAREGGNFAGSSRFGLFRHAVTPFSGGSDHYVLSDPTVNIPCPMVIQFPDRFYHTSEDTLDKVDPEMLRRVALMAAGFVYFAAAAGSAHAGWLGMRMVAGFGTELGDAPRDALFKLLGELPGSRPSAPAAVRELAAEVVFARRRARFLLERRQADLATLVRLAGRERADALAPLLEHLRAELERQAASWEQALAQLVEPVLGEVRDVGSPPADVWEERARKLVVHRRFRGPVEPDRRLGLLPAGEEQDGWIAFERDHRAHSLLRTLALYWADGRRTLADIIDLIELETGRRRAEYLVRSMELLARLGLVELASG